MDDAIRMLVGSHRESDEILDWLERCSHELLEGKLDDDPNRNSRNNHAISAGQGVVNGGGPAINVARLAARPAAVLPELESIRDLITFDHIYNNR